MNKTINLAGVTLIVLLLLFIFLKLDPEIDEYVFEIVGCDLIKENLVFVQDPDLPIGEGEFDIVYSDEVLNKVIIVDGFKKSSFINRSLNNYLMNDLDNENDAKAFFEDQVLKQC